MVEKNGGGKRRYIKYLLILFVACLVFYMSYSYAFLSMNPALSKEDAEMNYTPMSGQPSLLSKEDTEEIAESKLGERKDENESKDIGGNATANINPFLSKETAKKIVESKLGEFIQGDPMFEPWTWKQSVYGDPILVRTVEEEPSYWRVPVIFKEKVLGYIDVDGSGTIWRYGEFYESPDNLSRCPSVPTLITAAEAAELAEEITARYPDAEVSEPIFVHDGAKSKIAWMLKIEKNGEIISRVFLSGRYPYERRADEESIDIGGVYIAFEENITDEKEVKSILGGYDLILPYELRFVDYCSPFFYVIVPENTIEDIDNKLRRNRKNIFLSQKIFKKRNREVIIAIEGDKSEDELRPIMNSYGLSLKRFIWVVIDYKGSGISSEDGNALKENLEKNEKVIYVGLGYYA